MTTRRHVLQWLAASPALAACGGGDLPDPYAAWRDPGAGETDPRRFALAHAMLAPNPHNTQPWLVELDDADGMTLYCDLERRLPFTDPLDRQITIGCGAFLHLYWVALTKLGHGCGFDLFPEGAPAAGERLDARPIARARPIALGDESGPDLFERYITQRRTNRQPYDSERVPSESALNAIAAAGLDWLRSESGDPLMTVQWTTESERVARLRDLVWRAFDREMRTPGAAAETFEWLRFGQTEIARHRDGLGMTGPMLPVLKAAGMLDREELVDPDSFANKTAASDWRQKAETAPAFMWLATADDSAFARLSAGFAYTRMNLAATANGIAMHPWSQALQEYEEMADLYAEAREELSEDGSTVQMLVRVGHADPAAPSARRDIGAILRRASP
jgi:hypothetical protein